MKKAIIVSGYFNPIHKGHLEYFNVARSLGDELFVIVNNDEQRRLKGSKAFQDEKERLLIVSNIKAVSQTFLSIDKDRTVRETLGKIADQHGSRLTNWFLPTVVIKTTPQFPSVRFVRIWG